MRFLWEMTIPHFSGSFWPITSRGDRTGPTLQMEQPMSRILSLLAIAGAVFSCCFAVCPPAAAEEQHARFLEGLRERGYYDYALYYLDQLDERTDLQPDIKQVIPYERAITLLDGAKLINNPELRDEQLDKAVAQLEAFTRANPMHPLAGDANTQRARILIEKAHVKIWEAQSPANKDNSEKFRLDARELLKQARETFQKAHDLHKQHYESFEKYIPKEEKEKYAARQKAEIAYMRAQIDLALCTYAEAQTYEEGSQEFKNLLTKAADEFKDVHEKYRSMVGGLYSRMWQGKCFEEQDDIGKALGIYNELLGHQGQSEAMQTVKHQALQFRLICLNHDQRKDYQLVINEAGQWLGQNRKLQGTTVGLGIRYQKALAHEKMADKIESDYEAALNAAKRNMDKNEPLKPTAEIEGNLRKAMLDAQEVTQYAGQYKAPAQFMVSRIKGKLNLDEGPPKTIEEALVKADKMRQDIEILESEVEAAKTKAEKTNKQEELDAKLNETVDVLKLALTLADEETNIVMLNNVRFLLCYVYYKLERNYEAGVIGEFLAEHFAQSTDDPDGKLSDLAQKGATVARAAWYQEYQARNQEQADKPQNERDLGFELDQMIRVCLMATRLWPGTGLADDSWMTLGRIYSKREQPVEAAQAFEKVTSTENRGLAMVSAGQAYWNAYLNGAELPEGERPTPDELKAWQQNAKKYLEDGLKIMNGEVPEGADPEGATDLILARVTLAQINVYEQAYDAAIKYLTDTKDYHHAPLTAVKVDDPKERPAVGVKSQNFARLVYQVLLRAYVGKQQTDDALNTMNDLEKVVGKDNAAELGQTYAELGEQIGKEVKRLQAEGPQERLDQILASFDTFLNALYDPARRGEMSVGTLQWMAETFLNLGVSLKNNPNTQEYFNKAVQCYEDIIARGKAETPTPKWLTGMKLRLAKAQGSAQRYDKAIASMVEVLKEYPNAPNVQMAAAQLLQDWGEQQSSLERLQEAISGRSYEGQPEKNKHGIKGWGGLTVQYDLMLRPIRANLRKLRDDEEKILAFENTRREKASRLARFEAAKGLGEQDEQYQAAQADLDAITDAEAATRTWIKLRQEREQLKATAAQNPDSLKRIEQINRILNQMVDAQYYNKLASGALKKEYADKIAEQEKKGGKAAERRIEQFKQLIAEMENPEILQMLTPAYETGQRIYALREKLTAILQMEYDQVETSLKGNPNATSEQLLKDLERKIAAVKPQNMDDERIKAVQGELQADPVSKSALEQKLKVLREAVSAWTVYELVQDKLDAVNFDELTFETPELLTAVQEHQEKLAEEVAAAEAKEGEYQETLLEVLYHLAETRHKYAQVQSSTAEKEKALRRAVQDAASVTQRVPREDINADWWNQFNATYKGIRQDLQPLLQDEERASFNASADIPVPEPVSTDLTWLERPSNTVVVDVPGEGDVVKKTEEITTPAGPSMTLVILGVLLALGGTGAVVYFMMGSSKKKPLRVNYGAGPMSGGDENISFAGIGGESSPAKKSASQKTARPQPRPKKRPAASGQSAAPPQRKPAASGEAPRKAAPKKRPPQATGEGEPPKPKPRPKPRPSE